MMVIFRNYPEIRDEIGAVLLPHPAGGVPASYSGVRGPGISVNSR